MLCGAVKDYGEERKPDLTVPPMQEETKAKVSIGNTGAGSRAFLEQEAARLKEGAGNS